MKNILLLMFSLPAFGALSVQVTGATATQAAMQITGFSGTCTIIVSTTHGGGAIPDFNGSEYSGASTDTGRSDTLISSDGLMRLVTVGHMNDDRALQNYTTYYYNVSGCGTASGSFATANIPTGMTRTESDVVNTSRWANLGLPLLDWTRCNAGECGPAELNPYVDPKSGAKIFPLSTGTLTWRTGGGSSGLQPATRIFTDVDGGSGWTNPGHAINGLTSDASTTNTNPLDLYINLDVTTGGGADPIPYDFHRILEDVGAVIYGACSGCTGTTDKQINICLFTNPTAGCATPVTTVALTTTSPVVHVSSGSSDPNGAWPAAFPASPESSWTGGISPIIHTENMETYGFLSVVGSTLAIQIPASTSTTSLTVGTGSRSLTTVSNLGLQVGDTVELTDTVTPANFMSGSVTSNSGSSLTVNVTSSSGSGTFTTWTVTTQVPNANNNFSSALLTGAKIFVAGSSCTNSLCTVSGAPTSAAIATVSETPGNTGLAAFRAYGWGVRVAKVTATGTATIGAEVKLAGSNFPVGIQVGGDNCSTQSATSADSKPGYLCNLTTVGGGNYLAFIATDGTTRLLSSLKNYSFSDIAPNLMYQGNVNGGNGNTILLLTYTGDYQSNLLSFNYSCRSAGDCPPFSDLITTTDLMPSNPGNPSIGNLDQQIEANQGTTLPAYSSAVYGDWTTGNPNVSFRGVTGHFAMYANVYAGQANGSSGGPGWLAFVDLSTNPATVDRLCHTLDGTGCSNIRYAGLHSPQPQVSSPNVMFTSTDYLGAGLVSPNTYLHGGPYSVTPFSVLAADGVTWNTNTCVNSIDGSIGSCAAPLTTCPSTMNPTYTICMTVRVPHGGPCNVSPTSAERSNFPACPWNASFTLDPAWQVGDNATDLLGQGTDGEHFRILSITSPDPSDSSHDRIVMARNSIYDYCSFSPWQGQTNHYSAQGAGQTVHSNGWTLSMMPGTFNTCGGGVFLQDETTGAMQELGHAYNGHFSTGVNAAGINFVTSGASIYNTAFSHLGDIPYSTNTHVSGVQWLTNPSNLGSTLQSYTDNSQFTSGPPGYPFSFDRNGYTTACPPEDMVAGCGSPRTMSHVAGDVWKVALLNIGATELTYKTQPLVGFAGRFRLFDASGLSSNIDSTPYSMCFALNAGECHAASSANDIYVNVPSVYNLLYQGTTTYSNPSETWASVPLVIAGANAPANGLRQFGIFQNDTTGTLSRYVSSGWSAIGMDYEFSHCTSYPTGTWIMCMGTNNAEGFQPLGVLISIPPYTYRSDPANVYKQVSVSVPPGHAFVEIRFGYSRNIGPNANAASGFLCTSRADGCSTATFSSDPFSFVSQTRTGTSCSGGCTVKIPAVAPNLLYYQIFVSPDDSTWAALGDIQAISVN